MDRNNQGTIRGRPVSSLDAAKANEFFEHFINAGTLKSILGTYRSICELLHLKPNVLPLFYPKLKANLTSWRAKALWKKFDQRANAKCYGRGKLCTNTRVLIIGAGPCGLRTAIEAQLLGAKVVVVEKRDRMSRNNVLHLWRFVIEDLRALGAKKFFGKFCAGAIDHISIRQLQCILLKVALLLGVEIHTEVSFEHLIEPNHDEKIAWRGYFKPTEHPVSQFEFDVIIGADGKRNTLQGFQRKEFRGKLAIAITANFINKRTEAEARVEEISGVAFIFNQKFFKDLYADTGIDLENIVYYKDDTHYFVMTAKKASLINKGVIRQDLPDTAKLLAPDNVDRDALMNYAREAAEFSTHYQMPNLEFAVNHYGQPDVAMFDFTSMYQAENASKILERHGYKLLSILVGDSLLEPFWPTGSGCARGFLSSFDAGWAIRAWGLNQSSPLEIIAERESIYRLLAQTTPENLNKDYKAYTLDPSTRYPNLNKNLLLPHQTISFYDTDDRSTIELQPRTPMNVTEVPKKRRKRDSCVDPDTLLNWIRKQVREFDDIEIVDISSFRDGRILCAIIHHYRPDLIDYSAIQSNNAAKNNQLAFDILEKEIGIPPVMTGEEMTNKNDLDFLTLVSYLTQIYDTFRREIPHIKHPKMDLTEIKRVEPTFKIIRHDPDQISEQYKQMFRPHSHLRTPKRYAEAFNNVKSPLSTSERKSRKRRTTDKIGLSIEERQKRLEDITNNRMERQNKRRQQRRLQTEQFIKSMQMLQANGMEPTEPFEDYSIFLYRQTAPNFEDRVKNLEKQFTYVPDRENRRPSLTRGQADEDFAARIKCIEDKYLEQAPTEKKPKDLLRAIGKIETTDWNIKEIEKKIQENKLGKPINKEKEKVPKWNREQFSARLTKMEKQHLERQDSTGGKFNEIDTKIKQLDQKLKEGTTRDLNQQKIATITEKLTSKVVGPETKPIQRSNSKSAMVLSTKTSSEYCHFCSRRVYLVERLSTEGKFFHRGCFRCQYCHTALRLNSYTYDRDGRYGHRFFCQQHFGMPGELYPCKLERKESHRGANEQTVEKGILSGVIGVDLLDRVQTPERVEFENLSTDHISSEHEESISQMDEDEWTDRNFGQSAAELGSSDEYSSSSGSDSDSEDNYVEALEEPFTKEGTLRWKERLQKRYSKKDDDSDSEDYSSSDHSGYYDNMSDDDETDTATEGEDDIIARELRKQEVRVRPPVVHTDTGTDSEVKSSSIITPNNNNSNIEKQILSTPDILLQFHNNNNNNSNQINNLSVEQIKSNISSNSTDYDSAESHLDYELSDTKRDDEDINDLNLTDINYNGNVQFNRNPLTRSLTTSNLDNNNKIRTVRQKSFGKEFVPKFTVNDPSPLLIIKRTPSKLNLPKEIGKPRVAINKNLSDAKKYFGEYKKPEIPKPIIRSRTNSFTNKLEKQVSLPEKISPFQLQTKNVQDLSKEDEKQSAFNFEPVDVDSKEIDDYIENLIANEDELMKPIEFNTQVVAKEPEEESKMSSSIEDLLDALEIETGTTDEQIDVLTDDKIDDLLNWMEELEHTPKERKVYRSISDAKYRNLEVGLKKSTETNLISRLPKDNIVYFEKYLSGKIVDLRENSDEDVDDSPNNYIDRFKLTRSKTDVHCDRNKRNSLDIDACAKVNIKKVLQKFESVDNNDEFDKLPPIDKSYKRKSISSFKFNKFLESFEKGDIKNDTIENKINLEPKKLNLAKIQSDLQNVKNTDRNSKEFADKRSSNKKIFYLPKANESATRNQKESSPYSIKDVRLRVKNEVTPRQKEIFLQHPKDYNREKGINTNSKLKEELQDKSVKGTPDLNAYSNVSSNKSTSSSNGSTSDCETSSDVEESSSDDKSVPNSDFLRNTTNERSISNDDKVLSTNSTSSSSEDSLSTEASSKQVNSSSNKINAEADKSANEENGTSSENSVDDAMSYLNVKDDDGLSVKNEKESSTKLNETAHKTDNLNVNGYERESTNDVVSSSEETDSASERSSNNKEQFIDEEELDEENVCDESNVESAGSCSEEESCNDSNASTTSNSSSGEPENNEDASTSEESSTSDELSNCDQMKNLENSNDNKNVLVQDNHEETSSECANILDRDYANVNSNKRIIYQNVNYDNNNECIVDSAKERRNDYDNANTVDLLNTNPIYENVANDNKMNDDVSTKNPDTCSPQVPRRLKKLLKKQKSFEEESNLLKLPPDTTTTTTLKLKSADSSPVMSRKYHNVPLPPQRKKSNTKNPMIHSNENMIQVENVKLYNLPKPQTVNVPKDLILHNNNNNHYNDDDGHKYDSKKYKIHKDNNNKECSIQ